MVRIGRICLRVRGGAALEVYNGAMVAEGTKRTKLQRGGGVFDAIGWDALWACGERDGVECVLGVLCGV